MPQKYKSVGEKISYKRRSKREKMPQEYKNMKKNTIVAQQRKNAKKYHNNIGVYKRLRISGWN